jgi:hypothetical protein
MDCPLARLAQRAPFRLSRNLSGQQTPPDERKRRQGARTALASRRDEGQLDQATIEAGPVNDMMNVYEPVPESGVGTSAV